MTRSGRPVDQRDEAVAHAADPSPSSDRALARVTTLYGTSWSTEHAGADGSPLTAYLSFGGLEPFYQASADQLAEVVAVQPLELESASFRRWRKGKLTRGRLWLFVLPSEQVVVGLTLDGDRVLPDVVDLLEDCYSGEVRFADADVTSLAVAAARSCGVQVDRAEFSPERYQIVSTEAWDADNPVDAIQRLVYRADLDYRPEFSTISYPTELNRRPEATAAIGPYVSVLFGQPGYVENAAFVSAAQAVASSVRLREIRHALYRDLREFRAVDRTLHDTRNRRRALERITDSLTRLELDLSVAVEAPLDLGTLVPSLLVAEYHAQLYSTLGIRELEERVSRMLRRLEATGRAELASVESIERRADEDRHLRWAVGVGFVSVVAVPLSLILGFFGGNFAEVEGSRSLFDPAYLWVYGGVGLLILIAVALGLTLFLLQRRGAAEP